MKRVLSLPRQRCRLSVDSKVTEIASERRNSKRTRGPTSWSGWKATYVLIVTVRFYIPLRCWLELFMLYREYISTGENLHFLSEVCKQEVCLTIKRRMAKEMQVVGGPNSTGEGMNKINTGGKSRENCASQFWPAKLYQRGNISYTQR